VKIAASRDVASCSLLEVDKGFRLRAASIIILAVGISETLVYFNETTRRYTTEGCNLHYLESVRRCETQITEHRHIHELFQNSVFALLNKFISCSYFFIAEKNLCN